MLKYPRHGKITLSVEPRTLAGKKVKQLRRQELSPANIFGGKIKTTAVQVKESVFAPFGTKPVKPKLSISSSVTKKKPAPPSSGNIQRNPVSDAVIHVDFRQVDLKQKITANIPVEIVGESPAVKDFQAAIITSLAEIEVEALPTDLPEISWSISAYLRTPATS